MRPYFGNLTRLCVNIVIAICTNMHIVIKTIELTMFKLDRVGRMTLLYLFAHVRSIENCESLPVQRVFPNLVTYFIGS